MKRLSLGFYLFCYAAISQAEIVTDGSLGEQIRLEAPHFQISDDLGLQMGDNLFHSFETFNLQSHQTATFLGEDVQNIIARVTGGQPSFINGIINSDIPEANLYFLNPYGITFGKEAHLDIQGSFHATTADYLKFTDGKAFHARSPEQTLLTTADIRSFGFLTDTPADITFRGQGKLLDKPEHSRQLHLQPNATLSLIGGNIHLLDGGYIPSVTQDDDGLSIKGIERFPHIEIAGGNIFIVGVGSTGEVILDDDLETGIDISQIQGFADITLSDFSEIRASGQSYGSIHLVGKNVHLENGSQLSIDMNNNLETGGSVLIQAQQFLLSEGSQIEASTSGQSEGLTMRIEADELRLSGYDSELSQSSTLFQETQTNMDTDDSLGVLEVIARDIVLDDGASIYTSTTAKKSAPELRVTATEKLILQGNTANNEIGSNIYSYSNASSEQDAGQVIISAQELTILDGGFIGVETFGQGSGGSIFIQNTGNITIKGINGLGQASRILADAYPRDKQNNVGDAGNIFIQADNLTLEQGGNISSSVIAREGEVVGRSGKIEMTLTNNLVISGINPHGENIDGLSSGIRVQAREVGGKTGVAGNIEIEANKVILKKGGEINTNTTGMSNAGNIVITAEQIEMEGYAAAEDFSQSPAQSQQDFIDEFPKQARTAPFSSQISASTSAYYPQATGNAGTIQISTNNIQLSNAAVITNQTGSRGGGGNISITAQDIDLQGGSSITSETIGGGHAGNIEISADGTVSLSGTDMDGFASNIGSNSVQLPAADEVTEALKLSMESVEACDDAEFTRNPITGGDAGGVELQAQRLVLNDGANITSSVIASKGQRAGNGGAVKVHVDGETRIIGINPHGENVFGLSSGLYVRSVGLQNNVGNGGQLHLETGSLRITQGGTINSSTNNLANSGNIKISVDKHTDISGYVDLQQSNDGSQALSSQNLFNCLFNFPVKDIANSEINASSLFNSLDSGQAGNIDLELGSLRLSNQGKISTSGIGASAGQISIEADTFIRLNNKSVISTDSAQSNGGEITLIANSILHLLRNSEVSTSVKQAAGNGGDITLTSPFVVTEHSQIKTTAVEGNGGNIFVNATGIFDREARAGNDIFNTSSRLGIDGTIELDVMDVNVVALLNPLASQLQRTQIQYSFCDYGESHFKVKQFTGQRHSPFDWRASVLD